MSYRPGYNLMSYRRAVKLNDLYAYFAGRHYNASKADAIYVFVRHQLDRAALQANHLRQNRAMGVHHDVGDRQPAR